jgi:thioredoxin reductase
MKDKRLSAAGTSKEAYDLVVVGAGPAGLTAATYAARYRLGALVIGQMVGGTAAFAHEICNFPGFNRIKGIELARKFSEQVTGLGVEIKAEKVVAIQKEGLFAVETAKDVYYAKKLILATGSERRKLNLNNEHQYVGKGVSYCATCDAPFYRDKVVGVVSTGEASSSEQNLLGSSRFLRTGKYSQYSTAMSRD